MSLTLKMQFFNNSGLMKNLRKVLLTGKSKQCCLLSKTLSKTSCVKKVKWFTDSQNCVTIINTGSFNILSCKNWLFKYIKFVSTIVFVGHSVDK